MPKQNNPQLNTHTALALHDAYSLAENDTNWAQQGLRHVSDLITKLKDDIQQEYKAHDCYFDDLIDFIQMYEYLIETRHEAHKNSRIECEQQLNNSEVQP